MRSADPSGATLDSVSTNNAAYASGGLAFMVYLGDSGSVFKELAVTTEAPTPAPSAPSPAPTATFRRCSGKALY